MRRWIAVGIGWLLLVMVQLMVLPRWLPVGVVPDLLLLTVILIGFWRADARTVGIGLLVGLFQGWLHGAGMVAFALSRAFAAGFAGWLRVQWLWQSPPAAGFCAAVTTLTAEGILALLFALTERQLTPFAALLSIALLEVPFNALLAALIFWLRRPKEVLA